MRLFTTSFPFISVLLLLLLIFSCGATSPASTKSFSLQLSAPDMAAICDQTANRSFCLHLLNSTVGIGFANFLEVGKITLSVCDHKAREAQKYIRAVLLGRKSTDRKVRQSYKACLGKYGDATKSISVAKDLLVTGDYDKAFTATAAAQRDAHTCNVQMKGSPTAGLRQRNNYLFNLLDIVLVIVNTMGG